MSSYAVTVNRTTSTDEVELGVPAAFTVTRNGPAGPPGPQGEGLTQEQVEDLIGASVGTTAGTIAAGDDARFSDARTPTAHAASHGDGGSDEIEVAVSQVTGLGGAAVLDVGTTAGTVAAGDDGRLSDARTPTAHTHTASDVTGLGDLATQDTVGVSDIDATGTPSSSTFLDGSGAWSIPAGSGAVDSVNGQTGAVTLAAADVGADAAGTAAGLVDDLSGVSDATTARSNLGLGGAAVLAVGTTTGTVAAGDDARLSDARTPTAHAASHGDGGSDELALDGSQITTGTVADARIDSAIARDTEVTDAITAAAFATATTALGSSTGTVDLDCGDEGPDWTMTLTGNVALTASDVPAGAVGLTVRITQDGSGGHTLDLSGLGTVAEAGELADGGGEVTELSLITRDSGTTWSAFLVSVS